MAEGSSSGSAARSFIAKKAKKSIRQSATAPDHCAREPNEHSDSVNLSDERIEITHYLAIIPQRSPGIIAL
jgi:hypothetical protein